MIFSTCKRKSSVRKMSTTKQLLLKRYAMYYSIHNFQSFIRICVRDAKNVGYNLCVISAKGVRTVNSCFLHGGVQSPQVKIFLKHSKNTEFWTLLEKRMT